MCGAIFLAGCGPRKRTCGPKGGSPGLTLAVEKREISRRAENPLLRCCGVAVHYAPHAARTGFQRNTFLGDLLGAAFSHNQAEADDQYPYRCASAAPAKQRRAVGHLGSANVAIAQVAFGHFRSVRCKGLPFSTPHKAFALEFRPGEGLLHRFALRVAETHLGQRCLRVDLLRDFGRCSARPQLAALMVIGVRIVIKRALRWLRFRPNF